MWGANWGEMVWGGLVSVPVLGPLALGVLAATLAAIAGRVLRSSPRAAHHARLGSLAVVVIGLGIALTAHAVTLPFTFTNGTVADAVEVNGNLQALSDAIDAGPVVYMSRNFQNLSLLGATTPLEVASLTLPAGTYLLQAKMRFQNNGVAEEDAGCAVANSTGGGVGSFDTASEHVEPGVQVGGFMMTNLTISLTGDPVVNLNCYGDPDVSIINSHLIAMPAVISLQ